MPLGFQTQVSEDGVYQVVKNNVWLYGGLSCPNSLSLIFDEATSGSWIVIPSRGHG